MYRNNATKETITRAKAHRMFERAWFEYQLKNKKLDGFYKTEEEYLKTLGFVSLYASRALTWSSTKVVIQDSVYKGEVVCHARYGEMGKNYGDVGMIVYPEVVCAFNYWRRNEYNMETGEPILDWMIPSWSDEQKNNIRTKAEESFNKFVGTPKRLGWAYGQAIMTRPDNDGPVILAPIGFVEPDRFRTLQEAKRAVSLLPLHNVV